jgi:hypothetical protein
MNTMWLLSWTPADGRMGEAPVEGCGNMVFGSSFFCSVVGLVRCRRITVALTGWPSLDMFCSNVECVRWELIRQCYRPVAAFRPTMMFAFIAAMWWMRLSEPNERLLPFR